MIEAGMNIVNTVQHVYYTLCTHRRLCLSVRPFLTLHIKKMEQLPQEALEAVCDGLTGYELFQLSHVNSWLLQLLSASHRWRRLFPQHAGSDDDDGCASWTQRYIQSRSLVFEGLATRPNEDMWPPNRGRYVLLHYLQGSHRARRWRAFTEEFGPDRIHQSVTIDTWFALLPETDEVHAGGILFGAQSCYVGSPTWADYHQQIIIVDSDRNLFCSLVDPQCGVRRPTAVGLSFNRWYHLALSYDKDTRTEHAYLDGELLASRVGSWHPELYRLVHGQIGTGCVTAGENRFPIPGYTGWYGFNGIVDDFRVWRRPLTQEEVRRIAAGAAEPDDSDLRHAISRGDGLRYDTEKVAYTRCTRPRERVCDVQPGEYSNQD